MGFGIFTCALHLAPFLKFLSLSEFCIFWSKRVTSKIRTGILSKEIEKKTPFHLRCTSIISHFKTYSAALHSLRLLILIGFPWLEFYFIFFFTSIDWLVQNPPILWIAQLQSIPGFFKRFLWNVYFVTNPINHKQMFFPFFFLWKNPGCIDTHWRQTTGRETLFFFPRLAAGAENQRDEGERHLWSGCSLIGHSAWWRCD